MTARRISSTMPLNCEGFSCIQFCNKIVIRKEYFDEEHFHFETCLTSQKASSFVTAKLQVPVVQMSIALLI